MSAKEDRQKKVLKNSQSNQTAVNLINPEALPSSLKFAEVRSSEEIRMRNDFQQSRVHAISTYEIRETNRILEEASETMSLGSIITLQQQQIFCKEKVSVSSFAIPQFPIQVNFELPEIEQKQIIDSGEIQECCDCKKNCQSCCKKKCCQLCF